MKLVGFFLGAAIVSLIQSHLMWLGWSNPTPIEPLLSGVFFITVSIICWKVER